MSGNERAKPGLARARRLAYLDAMGVQAWRQRHAPQAPAERSGEPRVEPPSDVVEAGGVGLKALESRPPGVMDWDQLARAVSSCTACELHRSRTRTVFGVGSRNADWMIVGEAPGADEDRQGEPFVGRAGRLLNAMLLALGLQREQVFIANILKCRPPGNRNPEPREIACCRAFLDRQIELVNPAIILSMGRVSTHSLLDTTEAVGRLRGRVHRYGDPGVPLVVTYHPAYLLRSPLEKRKVWADLRLALARISHQ
jgi:DNA polymerase